MARLLSAATLREIHHCSACGDTNPVVDDGYTACCNKRECGGWGYSRHEGCCPATAERLADEAKQAARRIAERAAKTPVVVKEMRAARPAARTARASQGASSAEGWELLYDKPRAGVEIARRVVDGKAQYALVCKAHGHVRPLERLSDEVTVRKAGGWCPSC